MINDGVFCAVLRRHKDLKCSSGPATPSSSTACTWRICHDLTAGVVSRLGGTLGDSPLSKSHIIFAECDVSRLLLHHGIVSLGFRFMDRAPLCFWCSLPEPALARRRGLRGVKSGEVEGLRK